MAWTTPVTWTAGQVVGATDLNQQIRDNMLFLFSGRPYSNFKNTGSFSTSSTSLVAVSTSQCRMTVTPSHAASVFFLIVCFSASVTGSAATPKFDVYQDTATSILGDAADIQAITTSSSQYTPIAYVATISGLTVASHTFDIMWNAVVASQSLVMRGPCGFMLEAA